MPLLRTPSRPLTGLFLGLILAWFCVPNAPAQQKDKPQNQTPAKPNADPGILDSTKFDPHRPLAQELEASVPDGFTLIAVGVFFPVYLGLMGAIQSVDRKLVEVGRAFRLSDVEMVYRILLPAVLPAYVLSLRSGLGLGWMFVVAAEFLGASEGLGYLLIDGQQLGKPAEIVAAIVAFAIIGKASDWLIALAAAPFLRWEDVVRQD